MSGLVQSRRFNQQGRQAYSAAVTSFLDDPSNELPWGIAFEDRFSDLLPGEIDTDLDVATRFELAHVLLPLVTAGDGNLRIDPGQMDWIACVLFKQLVTVDGQTKGGEIVRYCLSSDFRKSYRHLIAGPLETYAAGGESSKFLLSKPVHTPGEIYEQLASRQEIRTNPELLAAAATLYQNAGGKPKWGAGTKGPGGARRLVDVIGQLDLTYDVYGMESGQLLALLPPEFDRWKG